MSANVLQLEPLTLLASVLTFYDEHLTRNPIIVKMISAVIVGSIGDILCQFVEIKRSSQTKHFRWRRLLVYGTVCGLYVAPGLHTQYLFLDNVPIPYDFQHSKYLSTAFLALISQLVVAPPYLAMFYFSFELISLAYPPYGSQEELPRLSNLWRNWMSSLKSKFWSTLKANWLIWPWVNFVTLYYIPYNYRVLFVNVVQVFWMMILSNLANKPNA